MSLQLVPVSFDAAAAFVAMWHRHHQPPQGHKFSIGAADDERFVAVIIIERPVARLFQDGRTLEATRSATDGTGNVNSMLYGAAWRATKALGYRRLITYTQADEPGCSLRAAGWTIVAQRPPRAGWNMPSRQRHDHGTDQMLRTSWEAV